MVEFTDEFGAYTARVPNGWALLAAWALFTISVAHFVWPARWTRRSAFKSGDRRRAAH